MRILLDAFGGDNAPLEILKGAELGVRKYGVDITLVGKEAEIKRVMKENGISDKNITIANADEVLSMETDPMTAVRSGKETSLIKGLYMLANGEGDAFVSAGSTGALMVGASLIVKRIKGIRRAALATVVPTVSGKYFLLDAGATVEVNPEILTQFGVMGSIYMEKVENCKNPRVALVNIGTEENKGTDLHRETYKAMQQAPFNFIGNVEGRDLPVGGCDVAVADGFTGNVLLKVTEGMGILTKSILKDLFTHNIFTKIGALSAKKKMNEIKSSMDYSSYGGAPLMGMRKPVIKAHGSSKANAILNAIRQAVKYVENDVVGIIEKNVTTEENSEK